jgi:hypothetical protein
MIDSITAVMPGKKKEIYLNGHSGGGSFIFGYLAGVDRIPPQVSRISFIDSDYGYDSTYYPKIRDWLLHSSNAALTVFAYNDSIVIYNGKPLVSPTGGTWYRSHLMLSHLQRDFQFKQTGTDSLSIWRSESNNIGFYFKYNIDGGIYHTQQVELNGFIHSVLIGTKQENNGYEYYGNRAYADYIR